MHHQRKELKTKESVDQIKCNCLILKIVIVGDPSTGKTSLLHQYIHDKFSIAYRPTVSFLASFVVTL